MIDWRKYRILKRRIAGRMRAFGVLFTCMLPMLFSVACNTEACLESKTSIFSAAFYAYGDSAAKVVIDSVSVYGWGSSKIRFLSIRPIYLRFGLLCVATVIRRNMSYVMTSITSIPGIKEIRSHSCIIPISSLSRPNAELCIIMSSMIFGIRRGKSSMPS